LNTELGGTQNSNWVVKGKVPRYTLTCILNTACVCLNNPAKLYLPADGGLSLHNTQRSVTAVSSQSVREKVTKCGTNALLKYAPCAMFRTGPISAKGTGIDRWRKRKCNYPCRYHAMKRETEIDNVLMRSQVSEIHTSPSTLLRPLMDPYPCHATS